MLRKALWPLLVALALAAPAAAQVVNPADAQQQPTEDEEVWKRLRTWEMQETVVLGQAPTPGFEEDIVGPYDQPRWTTKRLFPTTRIYVMPEGKAEFEFWTRVKTPKEGQTTVETKYELEFGLPNRFQLDLYYITEKTGSEGELDISAQSYELRYALADWGEIPMNPTLYFEWISNNGASDKYEAKLLLGDSFAPGWHWGSNLVYEHVIGGALESEYGITAGVSHTLIDSKLALGAEARIFLEDDHFDRGDYTDTYEVGPSLRWQPLPAMHVDFAPLFGIGPDSRQYDIFLVVGWEF